MEARLPIVGVGYADFNNRESVEYQAAFASLESREKDRNLI